MGLPTASLAFLRDLDANNDQGWFQANKKRYEADFKNPSRALVDEVNAQLAQISPEHRMEPGKAISRINRDIRFSADKTPYNVKLWAKFMPDGDAGVGFYFGLDLESLGVGAGCWMFPKDRIVPMQAYFAETWDLYQSIVNAPSFADYRNVTGEGLKRVPKPWPADHPAGELLKLKGIHTRKQLDLELVTSPDFARVVDDEFRKLKPFVDYVQTGRDGA